MNYQLDSVTLSLWHASGVVNLEVLLLSDKENRPDQVLETLAVNPTTVGTNVNFAATFTSSLTPVLNGGERYWLLIQPHDLDVTGATHNSLYSWGAGTDGGLIAYRRYENEWLDWNVGSISPAPGLRIEGTLVQVPEPSTWILLCLGGFLCWCAARRRISN